MGTARALGIQENMAFCSPAASRPVVHDRAAARESDILYGIQERSAWFLAQHALPGEGERRGAEEEGEKRGRLKKGRVKGETKHTQHSRT